MTLEEALNTSEETEEILIIDNDLRTISIPSSVAILGVESDDKVRELHFSMPLMYEDIDLSEFDIRINYMNPNGDRDIYVVTDKTISDNHISFSWVVGRLACKYKGETKFIVCLKLKNSYGEVLKEFNTTLATLSVLEGLETTEAVIAENTDVIEQILSILEKLEEGGGTGGNIKFSVTEDGLLNIEYVEGGGGTGGITFSMTEDGLLNIDYKESEAA